jgi:hypothetical protein
MKESGSLSWNRFEFKQIPSNILKSHRKGNWGLVSLIVMEVFQSIWLFVLSLPLVHATTIDETKRCIDPKVQTDVRKHDFPASSPPSAKTKPNQFPVFSGQRKCGLINKSCCSLNLRLVKAESERRRKHYFYLFNLCRIIQVRSFAKLRVIGR